MGVMETVETTKTSEMPETQATLEMPRAEDHGKARTAGTPPSPLATGRRTASSACVLLALIGWWGGVTLCELAEAWRVSDWERGLGASDRTPRPGPGALPSPRLLRQGAGVGPRRSLDLARFLWDEGVDADLERVPGVGPRTASAAREALAAAGFPGSGALPSPRGSPARRGSPSAGPEPDIGRPPPEPDPKPDAGARAGCNRPPAGAGG